MLFTVVCCAFAALSLLMTLPHYKREKRPALAALKTSLSGLASLAAVNSLSSFTGVALSLDYFTAGASVVLGIPGTVMLLFIRLLT